MINMKFLQSRSQFWQDKKWLKLDDVTPYCLAHRAMPQKSHQLDFVKEKWFRVYCGKYTTEPKLDRTRKLRKFYWNIHPNEWPFKLPRNK